MSNETQPRVTTRAARRHPWKLRAGAAVLTVGAAGAGGVAAAPAASADWTACGDYICTDYLDRQETEALNNKMLQIGRVENGTDLICDVFWPACFVRSTAEFDEMRDQVSLAAAIDGCLKKEYPTDPGQRTWVRYGVTDDPGWCYESFTLPSF